MNKKKLFLLVFFSVFALGAAFGSFKYINLREDRHEAENIRQELEEFVSLPSPTPSPTAEPEASPNTEVKATASPAPAATPVPDDTNWPGVDFEELLAINEDVVGWIHIENTNISYPILQGENNQEYLNTLITGEENRIGSIFLDYRNEKDFTDRNTVIYGHHLAVGTMFSELFKFKEEEFFRENDTVLIMTPEGNFRVKIFAVSIADLNDGSWNVFFDNDTQFLSWISERRNNALYTRDVNITAEDRVVTLSTCSYEFDEARFVVMGIIE